MAKVYPKWEHVCDMYMIDYLAENPDREWEHDEHAIRYGFEQRAQREGTWEANQAFLASGWNGPFADVEAIVRTGWNFAEREP